MTPNFLQNFRTIKQDYRLMLVTLFFMKMGQFMLLPFLAIYLVKHSNLSSAGIGITIGVGSFIYGITGIIAGVIIDRFGVKIAITWSLFIGAAAVFFFFYSHAIAWCIFMNALTGITRSFFDVGSKSYGMSGLSIEQRKFCFSLRFMVVNSSAAIGPIVGAYFAATDSLVSFKIIGISYSMLGILSLFILSDRSEGRISDAAKKSIVFSEVFKFLWKDSHLQILLLISFIFWINYSQLDTTLAQYLHASLSNGLQIYSLMLIINAVGCASLQLIVTCVTKNLDEKILSICSMIIFGIAYMIIALCLNISGLILASALIVLAETTIMPLNDLLLARIAPIERIGTYYGIIGLAMLGLGVGPMVGGVVYEYLSAKVVFLLCSSLSMLTVFLYKQLIDSAINCEASSEEAVILEEIT